MAVMACMGWIDEGPRQQDVLHFQAEGKAIRAAFVVAHAVHHGGIMTYGGAPEGSNMERL